MCYNKVTASLLPGEISAGLVSHLEETEARKGEGKEQKKKDEDIKHDTKEICFGYLIL